MRTRCAWRTAHGCVYESGPNPGYVFFSQRARWSTQFSSQTLLTVAPPSWTSARTIFNVTFPALVVGLGFTFVNTVLPRTAAALQACLAGARDQSWRIFISRDSPQLILVLRHIQTIYPNCSIFSGMIPSVSWHPERCDRFAPGRFSGDTEMWLHVHAAEDFGNREDSLVFSWKKSDRRKACVGHKSVMRAHPPGQRTWQPVALSGACCRARETPRWNSWDRLSARVRPELGD